jgi:hypothetical protein
LEFPVIVQAEQRFSVYDEPDVAQQSCAQIARTSAEDVVGTAGVFDTYVLVETPLPWPSGTWESSRVPELIPQHYRAAKESGRRIRLLALAQDGATTQNSSRRVLLFQRSPGPFSAYTRAEFAAPPSEVWSLVAALLEQPEATSSFERYAQPNVNTRDLLVCTHGSHDACCGSLGYPFYKQLRDALADQTQVRIWRCSHFGGHRFAPTMIDLPSGAYWGRLTLDAADKIVWRAGPVSSIYDHYRGWGGLSTAFEQIAEREILMREGWAWFDYQRSGQLLAVDGGLERAAKSAKANVLPAWAELQITFAAPDGSDAGVYEARVEWRGRARTGGCGGDLGYVNQYDVRRLERVG